VYKKLFFILVLGLFIAPVLVKSQVKLGFIISDQILQQLPEAQTAQKQLDAFQKEAIDTLQGIERDLQTKNAEFQQKESLMTEDAKKKAYKELSEQYAKYQEIQKKKSDELQKKRESLMQPIVEKINKTIEIVAKDEGLSFVFDKPVLLYGDQEFNITNKVLDLMIRGAKSTKKKGK
jgi:outer membrane protein